MTLQSGFCLCPDLGTDSKWSSVDLCNLFDLNGLSDMWNELVRTGELVLSNETEYISKFILIIFVLGDISVLTSLQVSFLENFRYKFLKYEVKGDWKLMWNY